MPSADNPANKPNKPIYENDKIQNITPRLLAEYNGRGGCGAGRAADLDGAGRAGTHDRHGRSVRKTASGQNGRHVLRRLARCARIRPLRSAPRHGCDRPRQKRHAKSVRHPEIAGRASGRPAVRTGRGFPPLGRTLPGLLRRQRRVGHPQTRANAFRRRRGRYHHRHDQRSDLSADRDQADGSLPENAQRRKPDAAELVRIPHAAAQRQRDAEKDVRQHLFERTVRRTVVPLAGQTAGILPPGSADSGNGCVFHDAPLLVRLAGTLVPRRPALLPLGGLLSAELRMGRRPERRRNDVGRSRHPSYRSPGSRTEDRPKLSQRPPTADRSGTTLRRRTPFQRTVFAGHGGRSGFPVLHRMERMERDALHQSGRDPDPGK